MATAMSAAPKSLSHLFQTPKDICQRCEGRVYMLERVGPVNGVVFHKGCFKCRACDQTLTLKTYFTSSVDPDDKNLYCTNHCPRTSFHGYDARAVGMQNALKAQSNKKGYNEQIRGASKAPQIGADAQFISQPVAAQSEYQRRYKTKYEQHHYFPAYYKAVNRAKEKLQEYQRELEEKQRAEEDRLVQMYQSERQNVQEQMQEELDREWEGHLKELTEKFDKEMDKKGKKLKSEESRALTMKHEQEKEEMKKNMTVKMKKKEEIMTLHLQKKAQEETSDLVQKHSKQMLELLQTKQDDLRKEIESELVNQNGTEVLEDGEQIDTTAVLDEALRAIAPKQLPPPHPPLGRKRDLYQDPSFFDELDEDVFKVAEKDQATFTELVQDLTKHCLTDLQKARAIFRWITVKDLNVMEFEGAFDLDTPLGLLRGIKYGTETYHTLFMRLCSYAGVPCVEIKGHSKSVGYEPGMKIREDTFQNTWNAVLIENDWWPVQCNWGARHLVLNKDQQKTEKNKKQDKIRYQYDEHYFLTDPDEFIQEFWARDSEWQLLEHSISLERFESMPFVRSVFFHYGLEFEQVMDAVLNTDTKGGAEVKIRVPMEYAKDLVFHYQIRFADRERRDQVEFRGAKLERFVFHSLVEGSALFSVHVPTAASFFLEIFANKIDDSNKIGNDPNATMMPFRLKCACKYKIVCEELSGKMHPLPNCASGEWGPSKGERHFGLKALTHMTGVINVDNDMEVRFHLPRPLHFLCKLRMNGVEDSLLEKYVQHSVHDSTLTVRVHPPQAGQYGLDIYARPEDATNNHTLAHSCKYLLNCTRVDDAVDMPLSKAEPQPKQMSKEKWGPAANFEEMGLRTLSHHEPTIDKHDSHPVVIEVAVLEALKVTCKLFREPDEECQDRVSMKESGKKVKFTVSPVKPGNYLLAIYARRKKDDHLYNVYNYLIRFAPEEKDSKKKKQGLFKK